MKANALTRWLAALAGHRSLSTSRLGARVVAAAAGLAIVLGATLAPAQAAPLGGLKQFPVPTDNSQPRHITVGADGNLWFTEGNEVFDPAGNFSNIGRITPGGEITEFRVDCQCFLNDIVQGPNNILYFTHNNPGLGRIRTSGQVLDPVVPQDEQGNQITDAIGNGIAAAPDGSLWFTDFNNNSLWRYEPAADRFTQYPVPTPGANPYDVAVNENGIVWFSESGANQIGRLNPETGDITETPVEVTPRGIAVAADRSVWFAARFTPQAVGRLDPTTDAVTLIPRAGTGPEDIAAAPDGSVWFTQTLSGNVARISADGGIAEGRSVNRSEPFGIAIGPDGRTVWYALMEANKIARLTPR